MTTNYQKHKEKLQKKNMQKISKSFWRRKRQKAKKKKARKRYQNFSEEVKESVSISGTQAEATWV